MSLLDSLFEEILLVFHLLVNVVALIIYRQCRVLWQNLRQAVWVAVNIAGFIFLLLQHFYTSTTADLWLSTYLTGLAIERYLSVACHQWHNKHVTQRKLTCVAIAVAVSFCCCVAISEFVLTEAANESGKVKEIVTSIIISLCSLLVLITQCVVCCKIWGFRKTHPHPTGLKVIWYTVTFIKDTLPPEGHSVQGLLPQGYPPPSRSFVPRSSSSRTHPEDCGNKSF